VRLRLLIVSVALVGAAAAVAASLMFARPEQDAIEQLLNERVGRPIEPLYGVAGLWTGAVLAWLRPRNRMGWLLVGVGGCQTLAQLAAGYGSLGVFATPDWPAAPWVAWVASFLWIPGVAPLVNVLPALYPQGRLPGPRWRWPVWAATLGIATLTLGAALSPDTYHDTAAGPSPLATLGVPDRLSTGIAVTGSGLLLASTLTIWAMSVRRLLSSRSPERQQLAWLLVVVVPMFATSLWSLPGWTSGVLGLLLPVSIAVGVLRYQMLGIEVVMRRGLVYGLLTALVLAGYLLVAEVVGTDTRLGSLTAVATAAVIALVLAPLRERLQRAVDRLLYGDRQDPVGAVSRVSRQLAGSDEPDLLRSVLTSVAAAVRAPGAAVTDPDAREIDLVGEPAPGLQLPLTVGARPVGALHVANRRPGERYTVTDLRLLDLLAPQLAVVVYTLDLTDALEAERDHVLEATRSERERLRCDLHDGLGPSLSGVRLGLVAAGDALAAHDTSTAAELLDRLRIELGAALAEVRRIIDGLHPASLDTEGLVPALRRQLLAAGVTAELVVADLAPVTTEVETAALRISAEALTNVGKHAHATHVTVRLETADGDLRLSVTDDGCGLGSPARALTDGFSAGSVGGIGLASMKHRAEAVGGSLSIVTDGGGTTVAACLPRHGTP